ncbi:DsbA family protein [Sphingomonas sp. ID0503]|uniref:DsbA family protein n=1 Tax=Sphingomonas sp. ID0503 TaxID=3399691 RepID=UPI003AFB2F4F
MRQSHVKLAAPFALALALAACDSGDKPAEGNSAGTTAGTVPPPAGQDWTETVVATEDGGFLMGNPNAKVKLVEYGSMTCPHCAEFATQGVPSMKERYIRTGQVSLEFRNFVRDGTDTVASLLARCAGAEPFFKLTEQMYADQPNWIKKAIDLPEADRERMSKLPTEDQLPALAAALGLDQFMRMRGITNDRVKACLNDEAAVNKLQAINQKAINQYKINGTPGFLINGETVEGVYNWETLEPRIQDALGA